MACCPTAKGKCSIQGEPEWHPRLSGSPRTGSDLPWLPRGDAPRDARERPETGRVARRTSRVASRRERKEYRELVAGDRSPSFETWDRIYKLCGWPQTFVTVL